MQAEEQGKSGGSVQRLRDKVKLKYLQFFQNNPKTIPAFPK